MLLVPIMGAKPKPQVVKVESVAASASVSTPSIVLTHSAGDFKLVEKRPPGSMRRQATREEIDRALDAVAGSPSSRELVALEDALLGGDLGRWAERIASSPALKVAAEKALAAYRWPLGRPRGSAKRLETRTETFMTLAMALGLCGSEVDPENLRRRVRAARRRQPVTSR